jgi:hypothetical protein
MCIQNMQLFNMCIEDLLSVSFVLRSWGFSWESHQNPCQAGTGGQVRWCWALEGKIEQGGRGRGGCLHYPNGSPGLELVHKLPDEKLFTVIQVAGMMGDPQLSPCL